MAVAPPPKGRPSALDPWSWALIRCSRLVHGVVLVLGLLGVGGLAYGVTGFPLLGVLLAAACGVVLWFTPEVERRARARGDL